MFGEIAPLTCKISPSVPLSILNHFARRQDVKTKVVGLLFGIKIQNVNVEIKHAVPMGYTIRNKKVEFASGVRNQVNGLLQLYPNEQIIGLYISGNIDALTVMMQKQITDMFKFPSPILMTFSMTNRLNFGCFMLASSAFSLATFKPIPFELLSTHLEQLQSTASKDTVISDVLNNLSAVKEYIKKIQAGSIEADPKIIPLCNEILRQDPSEVSKEIDLSTITELANQLRKEIAVSDEVHATL